MASAPAGRSLCPFRTTLQTGLVIAALCLWDLRFLRPVKLMVVLLHELSHGLMALATGGAVHDVLITPNEGGACETTGGNALLIVSAGYLGSMFFGGLLLGASRSRGGTAAAWSVLAVLLLGAAFTVVDDGYSRRFAVGVAAAAIFIAGLAPVAVSGFLLRSVGTVSCLYALIDLYNDVLSARAIAGRVQSDASAFSELTGVDPCLVGIGWLAVSAVYFLATLKRSVKWEIEGLRN